MSVQVRRRREAAAFLSTYVGAQGELLVDTTNNRLQVHDGATPGGFPAAKLTDVAAAVAPLATSAALANAVAPLSGRNAIINGNFSINQRGYASGTALAAGAYAHDRFKAGSAGCTYTFAQTVPDTTVTITAGSLLQIIDASNVYATSFWLTWAGSATVRVWQGAASGTFSAGTAMTIAGVTVNAILVTGLTTGAVTSVEFSTGTLGLVQLEAALPNAGPTRFERRHNETVLCRRYYESINFGLLNTATAAGQYFSIMLGLVPKRVAPTLSTNFAYLSNAGTPVARLMAASETASCQVYFISSAAGTSEADGVLYANAEL